MQELEGRIAELEQAMAAGGGAGVPAASSSAGEGGGPEDAGTGAGIGGGVKGNGGEGGEVEDAALSADLWRLLESNRKMASQMKAYSQVLGGLQPLVSQGGLRLLAPACRRAAHLWAAAPAAPLDCWAALCCGPSERRRRRGCSASWRGSRRSERGCCARLPWRVSWRHRPRAAAANG